MALQLHPVSWVRAILAAGSTMEESMGQDLKYLYNVANQFMGKFRVLEVVQERYWDHNDEIDAEAMWSQVHGLISIDIRTWKSETLGRIAAFGRGNTSGPPDSDLRRTTLYEVWCGSWLDKHGGGQSLLINIAATTITAAIYDVVKAKQAERRVQKRTGMPIPNASDYDRLNHAQS